MVWVCSWGLRSDVTQDLTVGVGTMKLLIYIAHVCVID